MAKRPRITKQELGEVIVDTLAYEENIGSKNARKVIERSEHVYIEIWYDKHYINRINFGDEQGARDGIDEKIIEKLVSDSLIHLIHYSFLIKNFSFVSSKQSAIHSNRLVLKQDTADGLLNIVVGFYHIMDNKYELTVYTAMVVDNFRISDGQYALSIDDDGSTLYKMDNRKLSRIATNP